MNKWLNSSSDPKMMLHNSQKHHLDWNYSKPASVPHAKYGADIHGRGMDQF